MIALVTGASHGIGYSIAKYLSLKGYDIIAISRNRDQLERLKENCSTNVEIIEKDLSNIDSCKELYNMVCKKDIDIVVNNAGIGMIGEFYLQDLAQEMSMINLNINAVHILTKLFLNDMIKKDKGYILNVSSSAAFLPGPLMATYYATKSYVLNMTQAIYKELEKKKSKVHVSILCPGPVNTNFNENLGIKFSVKPISPEIVAKYAIDNMLKGKTVIVPGFKTKFGIFLTKILPRNILLEYIYKMQQKKLKNNKRD